VTRTAAWVGTTLLVVLAGRTLAYAAEPSPLARQLQHGAGGPRLWATTLVALVAGFGLAAALVWLASVGVEERRRLEPRRVVGVPVRPRLGLLAARAAVLAVVSSLGFALFESTLHWRAGLGWHGLSCLTGPVHRDALPILVALSLVAAAAFAAGEHVVAWLRRTLARLAAVRPLVRPPALAAIPVAVVLPVVPARLSARGPPVVAR
jgi:hypothetical protein